MASLGQSGLRVFAIDDAKRLAAKLGIGDHHLRQLLHQLSGGSWVRRLRRGLYVLTDPAGREQSPHPFVIATRLVQPSVISHWSALSHHELTEQVPRDVMAWTTRKIVTPSMRTSQPQPAGRRHAWVIDGTRYQYHFTQPERLFGTEEVWIGEHDRVPITDKSRTVLDMFISPRIFGGLSETLTVLEDHRDGIDLKRLVAYAVRYGQGAVAKRIGWALEHVGVPRSVLKPLADLPIGGYRLLDPTRPPSGPWNARWMLRENLPRRSRA